MRRLTSVFLGLAMFLVSTAVLGQGNPRGLTSFVAGRADMVSIEYGRPSLHGKTVGIPGQGDSDFEVIPIKIPKLI
jgi:hypothetical protein